jgi:hypothetical protein
VVVHFNSNMCLSLGQGTVKITVLKNLMFAIVRRLLSTSIRMQ